MWHTLHCIPCYVVLCIPIPCAHRSVHGGCHQAALHAGAQDLLFTTLISDPPRSLFIKNGVRDWFSLELQQLETVVGYVIYKAVRRDDRGDITCTPRPKPREEVLDHT